jgi:hypothetical protein
MNGMEKTVAELPGMLLTIEDSIKKNLNHVMIVQKEKKKRRRWMTPMGKGKEKVFDEPSGSKPKTKGKFGPSPDEKCFHCHKKGHWFRNYKKYLEEQKNKNGSETFTSGINVIETNIAVSSSDSWIFDTRSMIHTSKSLQGLSLTRRFTKGELDVCVGNGANVAVIVVDTYHLPFPLDLVLKLNNCYCIPSLCKNIISSSCLEVVDVYDFIIKNKHCSIYYNGIFYAHCPLMNGLYVLDLEDKYVYNINTKRDRLNDLNPTFIWHYRLGYINEKHIERLHKDGLLSSFDFELFDTCEFCLLGKMTKASFTGQSEKASKVLGLVHSNMWTNELYGQGWFSVFHYC